MNPAHTHTHTFPINDIATNGWEKYATYSQEPCNQFETLPFDPQDGQQGSVNVLIFPIAQLKGELTLQQIFFKWRSRFSKWVIYQPGFYHTMSYMAVGNHPFS